MKIIAETEDGYLWETTTKEAIAILSNYTGAYTRPHVGAIATVGNFVYCVSRLEDLAHSAKWKEAFDKLSELNGMGESARQAAKDLLSEARDKM